MVCMNGPAQAQYPGAAPEWWPCAQRYVPELSAGVFWTGALPKDGAWQSYQNIVELAAVVTDRNLPLAQAVAMLKEFFGERNGAKPEAAQLLAGAMTEAANMRRDRVMAGIRRFGERQQMMVMRIEKQANKIGDIEQGKEPAATLNDLRARQKWDIRVFEEREKLTAALCEQPVLLEQRLFSLGRNLATYSENAVQSSPSE